MSQSTVQQEEIFDGAVLDLEQLPAPMTEHEHAVHSVARAEFAVLADLLQRQDRGETVPVDEMHVAESDATELLLAYKRLLSRRV
jgi:type II secretory pathway predicted ATPase ExeA